MTSPTTGGPLGSDGPVVSGCSFAPVSPPLGAPSSLAGCGDPQAASAAISSQGVGRVCLKYALIRELLVRVLVASMMCAGLCAAGSGGGLAVVLLHKL